VAVIPSILSSATGKIAVWGILRQGRGREGGRGIKSEKKRGGERRGE
jgi:hypothetical protein